MDGTSILQGTLVDYTDWLLRQPGSNIGSGYHGSPNELRGIFYNKLIARLRESFSKESISCYDLRRAIHPEDMTITFRPPGFVTSLIFNINPHLGAHTSRFKILDGLRRALGEIDVLDYHTRFSYELSKIISELKKL